MKVVDFDNKAQEIYFKRDKDFTLKEIEELMESIDNNRMELMVTSILNGDTISIYSNSREDLQLLRSLFELGEEIKREPHSIMTLRAQTSSNRTTILVYERR